MARAATAAMMATAVACTGGGGKDGIDPDTPDSTEDYTVEPLYGATDTTDATVDYYDGYLDDYDTDDYDTDDFTTDNDVDADTDADGDTDVDTDPATDADPTTGETGDTGVAIEPEYGVTITDYTDDSGTR